MRTADSDLLGVEKRSVATFRFVRADDDADVADADVKLSTGGGSKRSYFKTRLKETSQI